MYLQATTTGVWAPCGQTPTVRVDPGRRKVGFYGTLNLHTGDVLVTRATALTAQASSRHLQRLLDAIPNRPILLLWDRAPWHRGPAIRQLLALNPRLEILEYPVATPDLNPQEHVWKQTRRAVSHNHLTPKLPELADRFEQYLTSHTFESAFLDKYGFNSIRPMFN
jgi:transposase